MLLDEERKVHLIEVNLTPAIATRSSEETMAPSLISSEHHHDEMVRRMSASMVHVVMNSHSTQPKEGIEEARWDLLLGEKVASLSAEMKLRPKEQYLDSEKFCIRSRHISTEFVHTFDRAASFLTATYLLQRYLFIALFPLFSLFLCIPPFF